MKVMSESQTKDLVNKVKASKSNDYSLNEIETTDKWVDGKTIYKKTLELTKLANAGEYADIKHGASVDMLIKIESLMYNSDKTQFWMVPYMYLGLISFTPTLIRFYSVNDMREFGIYATIYYTKK